MQSVSSLFSGDYAMPSSSTLRSMMDFDNKVAQHLRDVYACLCLTLLSASIGCYVHLQTHLGGTFSAVAAVLLAVYIGSTSNGADEFNPTRFGLMLGFGLLKGLSIGGLIEHALFLDPALLISALLATTVVFGCFSAAAMFARRRSYLYLGAILGSVMFYMAIASLANMFLGWQIINEIQIYGGLLVFSGYVVYDTQVIIEKAANGHRDVIAHALELFVDFVAIFVRILIILMRNAENNKKKKRNN